MNHFLNTFPVSQGTKVLFWGMHVYLLYVAAQMDEDIKCQHSKDLKAANWKAQQSAGSEMGFGSNCGGQYGLRERRKQD